MGATNPNFPRQYGLQIHYPAPVLTTLAVGIVESAANARVALKPGARDTTNLRAVLLVGLVVIAHIFWGYIRTGGHSGLQYHDLDPEGAIRLHASHAVPKEGVLITTRKLASYTANRRDITFLGKYDPNKIQPDVVFERVRRIRGIMDGELLQNIRNESFGVVYYDTDYFVAQRNGPTGRNKDFLFMIDNAASILWLVNSSSEGGDNLYDPGVGLVRHWEGDGSRAPITVSYNARLNLPAGNYTAHILYRAEKPRRVVRDSWGQFGVFPLGRDEALAAAPIEKISGERGVYREQTLDFANPTEGPVEFRVIGADAPLWLLSARFEARPLKTD